MIQEFLWTEQFPYLLLPALSGCFHALLLDNLWQACLWTAGASNQSCTSHEISCNFFLQSVPHSYKQHDPFDALHHSGPPPLIRAASLYAIPTPLLCSTVLLTVRHLLLRRPLLEHSHSVFLLSPLIFLSITASSFSILMVFSFPKEFRASFC